MKLKIIGTVALTAICLLLVIPTLIHAFPFLAGANSSYTVMSGSMSPTLKPGDLILVKQTDPATVDVNDIVTVKYETGVFTHRVFEKKFEEGIYLFKTKGDANEEPDLGWWNASQIMGKTVFVIPLGHLYSPYGYTLSFLVPCVLLVGKQMKHVFSLFKRRSKREFRRWRRQKHPVLDTTSVLLLFILVISGSWLVAPYFQLGSFSYFSDSEWAEATFTAGQWVVEVEIDIDPDTLNLGSQGTWTTIYAYIKPSGDYNASDVDVSTILLEIIPADWGDVQGENCFMAKFNRTSVINYLFDAGYGDGDVVMLTVTGQFTEGMSFQGSDTINLIE
ncbi:signal peptidase I [Candidatus Bathyarchaeota archaeon]|nr:MAG: signal peptidase I [Candidatus Bathyarchaeota archaeon]